MRPIGQVAESFGLRPDEWDGYGPGRAKLKLEATRSRGRGGHGRLVLVSAMTPTPTGEGKTTTAIGLAQGLVRLGHRAVACLREPSIGPVFGAKGGGTGGGLSRVHPSDAIDLHFTGDLHAITAANNLLAAMVDSHLHHGRSPRIDPRRVTWRRVLDVNDRALRSIVTGLDQNGPVRETGFDITAASEVMAVLCLATDEDDLRRRLGRMIVAYDGDALPVTAGHLGAEGAMMALLHDALRPNLVQTTDGVPALVHGGPFANIAHGCSSVLATKAGLARSEWVVTEAGFGFDLGGEKFYDLKCRAADLDAAAVVLVGTVRALRWHGGGESDVADPGAVERGLQNLEKQVDNVLFFGEIPIVALNRRPSDHPDEVLVVRERFRALGVPIAECSPYDGGGEACLRLAELVVDHAERTPTPFKPLYAASLPVAEKVETVATSMYGADGVDWTKRARADLERIRRLGLETLPVCVAKTPLSLTDDAAVRGRPTGFRVTVEEVRIAAGAGFVVPMLGDVVRMPGLPSRPSALDVDVKDGVIVGLR